MKKKFRTVRWTALLAVFLLSTGLDTMARAEMSEADYQAALKIAQKKASRTQQLRGALSSALSTSLITQLYGQNYKVGDQWDVVAWSYDQTVARMTEEPSQLAMTGGKGATFHYEVVNVKSGSQPEITLRITQRKALNLAVLDPHVDSLKVVMNDKMTQNNKTYVLKSGAGRLREVQVSANGIKSSITSLELFPLDVPELSTAESARAHSLPKLPAGLQNILSQVSYQPDLSKSLWFEQDDFFGRPIQALWQQGDPWPAFLKTSNGVSILIRGNS